MAIESFGSDTLSVQTLLQTLTEQTKHLYSADSVPQWVTICIAILVALYTRRRMLIKLGESGSASSRLKTLSVPVVRANSMADKHADRPLGRPVCAPAVAR